jgi:hypothetical protein
VEIEANVLRIDLGDLGQLDLEDLRPLATSFSPFAEADIELKKIELDNLHRKKRPWKVPPGN